MSAPDLAMPSVRLPVSAHHATEAASALAGYSLQAAIAAARRQKRGAILYPRLIVLAGTWWRQTAPGAELQKLEVRNG